jgi:hypothetical protein
VLLLLARLDNHNTSNYLIVMGSAASSSRAQAKKPSDAVNGTSLVPVVVNQEAKKLNGKSLNNIFLSGSMKDLSPAAKSPAILSAIEEMNKGYFYVEKTPNGKRKAGPFTLNEMRALSADGSLDSFTLVWHKSFGSTWKHATDIQALRKTAEAKNDDLGETTNHEELIIAARDGNKEDLARLIDDYRSKV